jgi:hypothetical protein
VARADLDRGAGRLAMRNRAALLLPGLFIILLVSQPPFDDSSYNEAATGRIPPVSRAVRRNPPPGGLTWMEQYGPNVGLRHRSVSHDSSATGGIHYHGAKTNR